MKKSLLLSIILPLAAVTLAGCVKYNGRNKDGSPKGETTSGQTSNPSDPGSGGEGGGGTEATAHLYLVLGPHGLFDEKAGANIEGKFLENAVEGDFVVGSALPGKDRVSSSIDGATFEYWINRETTEIVTSVPNGETVLVAVFSDGNGDAIDNVNNIFGFLFDSREIGGKTVQNVPYKGKPDGNDPSGRPQFKIEDMAFKAGEHFVLWDFGNNAGWAEPIEDSSLGGNPDEYLEIIDGSYYNVKKDFEANNIYIKIAYGNNSIYMGLK